MTNDGTKLFFFEAFFYFLKTENDKCIFILIIVMWITPDRWHNISAKMHQNEAWLFF